MPSSVSARYAARIGKNAYLSSTNAKCPPSSKKPCAPSIFFKKHLYI